MMCSLTTSDLPSMRDAYVRNMTAPCDFQLNTQQWDAIEKEFPEHGYSRPGREDPLGEGGFGRAYRTFDETLTLKVMKVSITIEHEGMIQQEWDLMQRNRHPHIPAVFEVVFFESHPVVGFVMEFAPNGDLQSLISAAMEEEKEITTGKTR